MRTAGITTCPSPPFSQAVHVHTVGAAPTHAGACAHSGQPREGGQQGKLRTINIFTPSIKETQGTWSPLRSALCL